jgi:hypothetical protein
MGWKYINMFRRAVNRLLAPTALFDMSGVPTVAALSMGPKRGDIAGGKPTAPKASTGNEFFPQHLVNPGFS